MQTQQIYGETEDDVYQPSRIPVGQEIPPHARILREDDGWVQVEEKMRCKNGPHQDLAAILAYLKVYEDAGYETRMVFGFD